MNQTRVSISQQLNSVDDSNSLLNHQKYNVMQNNAKFTRFHESNNKHKHKHSHSHSHSHKTKVSNNRKLNKNHGGNNHRHHHNYEHGIKREWQKYRWRSYQTDENNKINDYPTKNMAKTSDNVTISELMPILLTTVQPHTMLAIDKHSIKMTNDNENFTSDRMQHTSYDFRSIPQIYNTNTYKVRRRHAKRWSRQHIQYFHNDSKSMLRESAVNAFSSHYQHEQPAIMLDGNQMASKSFADMEIQSMKAAKFVKNNNNNNNNETNKNIAIHWPVKKEAIMEGDVILGGLMMVHSREDSMMCGPIMPQGGIQALEAMLYTLDKINEDKILLPNITIGAHILDDCDRDSYGLEMAVDFIKGMLY